MDLPMLMMLFDSDLKLVLDSSDLVPGASHLEVEGREDIPHAAISLPLVSSTRPP